jgi:hypothetical protein
VSVRILTTSDFVGSFFPQPTSWGTLPGGAGLAAAVDDLRDDASLWIDTGDVAQGTALGALSDGAWGFLAMRELPVDVGVAGNHELDWGAGHLRTWASELCFPLLAANADLGLPSARLVAVGDSAVGVIGLTTRDLPSLHPGTAMQPAPVEALAADLRRDGADRIVLALHDGPDEALSARVRGHVDLVLGGHTLGCVAGRVAGVPFLQPWPCGSQVGVADLHDDGSVELRLVDVTEPRAWLGPGAAAQAALEAEVVGHLDAPLGQAAGGRGTLGAAIGAGLLRAQPELAACAGTGDVWTQAARDGLHAHLPAGDVTRAQVLRATPLTGGRSAWGGQLVAAELDAAETDSVLAALAHAGVVAREHGRAGLVALAPHRIAAATAAIDRDPGWAPIAATWRDALLAAVGR